MGFGVCRVCRVEALQGLGVVVCRPYRAQGFEGCTGCRV